MNFSVLIVDDEYHALEVLTTYVAGVPELRLLAAFTHPLEALQWIKEHGTPDVLLLDIDMPRLSGLALARLAADPGTRIVFTTSHREFGPEAFELGAADYLLKPVSLERFLQTVQKINSLPLPAGGRPAEEFFMVKTGTKGHLRKIKLADILYVESALNYVEICLPEGKISTYLTLAELEQRLDPLRFQRIHRSFLLNTDHLSALEPARVMVSNGQFLPLGRAYRQQVMEAMSPHTLVSARRTTPES